MGWTFEAYLVGKVLIAMVLGGAIGLEREFSQKPAGLRTHLLVAGGMALLIGSGRALLERYTGEGAAEYLRADPFRLYEAAVTGLAFLGAGSIIRLRDGDGVEGLTTAGTILIAGAVGICVAEELFLVAGFVSLSTLVLLRILRRFEGRYLPSKE